MSKFDGVDLGSERAMQRMVKAHQEAAEAGVRNERADFAAAVKAMAHYACDRPGGGSYISQEEAEPFVASLPEFWREPARVMACCGYYASADGWMKEHVE